jgi:beta-lactamase regulating signal transducer with metallopeptidase domain
MLPVLATVALNAVWQVPVFAAAAWCASRVLRRLGPQLEHRVWVGALMLSTLVPLIGIVGWGLPVRPHMMIQRSSPAESLPDSTPARPTSFYLPHAVISLAAGLYVLSLVLFLQRLFRLLCAMLKLVRNSTPVRLEPEFETVWREAKEAAGLPNVDLRCSAQLTGPAAAGILQPVVLLPANFLSDYSPNQFRAAMAHECAHIQRRDLQKNWWYEVAAVFTAFHPATWFIKSYISRSREKICDQLAANRLDDRESYAASLLQLARTAVRRQSVSLSAMGIFDSDQLEERIMELKTSRPIVGGVARRVSVLGAVFLFLGSAALCISLAKPVEAQGPSPAAQTETGNKKELSCTYYDQQDRPHPGTCGFDKNDKKVYRCYSNEDKSVSQIQIACESKLRKR